MERGYYNARALPSAGGLPVLQSLICNVDNKCLNKSSYEEIPTYPGSRQEFGTFFGVQEKKDTYYRSPTTTTKGQKEILQVCGSFETSGKPCNGFSARGGQ
ncbi:hypothetical protein HPB52_003001 [Rhipicephalus sanguineus]|uniref:Uncharacterized protein n=1 Tax=Rhipicephalus sanguineus TaxID=34632 RepID=A0A9D4PYE6_RHISA|nr:hypothetical protein HPB52_003001 [Rhipicephalus sanguineus]